MSNPDYTGTFPVEPFIVLNTESRGVQANIEFRLRTGFEICSMSRDFLTEPVTFNWTATENQTIFCDSRTEIQCGSGECASRESGISLFIYTYVSGEIIADFCNEKIAPVKIGSS